MRRFLVNKYGDPLFRFRLSHLFLVVLWVAAVSSLHNYPWLAAGTGALLILGYLHHLSIGRTTPLAAFAFVLSTALAGFVVGIPYAIAEAQGKKHVRLITEGDIQGFFAAIICFGIILAALVAVITAIEKRDEWFNHL